MNKYISVDKVAQLVQTLRDKGLPYVFEEDNQVVAVLSDGTYYRIGIVEHHSCGEIVADVLRKEEKAISYLTPDTL